MPCGVFCLFVCLSADRKEQNKLNIIDSHFLKSLMWCLAPGLKTQIDYDVGIVAYQRPREESCAFLLDSLRSGNIGSALLVLLRHLRHCHYGADHVGLCYSRALGPWRQGFFLWVFRSTPGFLNLNATDTFNVWILCCWGYFVHCKFL